MDKEKNVSISSKYIHPAGVPPETSRRCRKSRWGHCIIGTGAIKPFFRYQTQASDHKDPRAPSLSRSHFSWTVA